MKSVDMLKAGLVCHREDDEESISCPHILLPHSTEFLLTGCVQHYEDGGTQMCYLMWMGLPFSDFFIQNTPIWCTVFHMGFEHTVGPLYNLVGLQCCHYVSYYIYRPPYIFNVHFSGCENCSIRHISNFYFILLLHHLIQQYSHSHKVWKQHVNV